MTQKLTPELALAIQGAIDAAIKAEFGKDDPRDKVLPDQTIDGLAVNLTVEVGSLQIGHDTDKTPTCSIPLLPTLALLVKRMGATRDAALQMIKDAMTEALTLDKGATEALMAESGVAEAETLIKEKVIATLPRTKVRKAVKVKDATVTITLAAQKTA